MSTPELVLTIDELRVLADCLGLTLPGLLDEYATSDPAADAAAERTLLARGLVTQNDGQLRVDGTVRAMLAPAATRSIVVELDREPTGSRCAELHDPDGATVGFVETYPDVWKVTCQPVVAASVADLLDRASTAGTDRHDVVTLSFGLHDAVAELMAAGQYDGIRRLLERQPGANALADTLADPRASSGRITRVTWSADGLRREDSCAWQIGAGGTWTVYTAEPVHAEDRSVFVPADATELSEQIGCVLSGRTAVPAGV